MLSKVELIRTIYGVSPGNGTALADLAVLVVAEGVVDQPNSTSSILSCVMSQ
jgi:hypothetical protein